MTARVYDATAFRWKQGRVWLPSDDTFTLQRTNESLAPRAGAGSQGYRSNDGAKYTVTINSPVTGHPLGITTAARIIPVGTPGIAVGSIYGVDGRDLVGNITLARAFGCWVYCNRAVNVECYTLDNRPGTTKTTLVPALTWTWVTVNAVGTGHSILSAVTTSGNAVVGTDYLLVTGTISETTGVPTDFFDGWTKGPRTNLVDGGFIDLGTVTRVNDVEYKGKTWSRITPGVNAHGVRAYALLASLTDGWPYMASWEVANDRTSPVSIQTDWCDGFTSGTVVLAPGEVRRFYVGGALADYTSTFRFTDLAVNVAGTSVLVARPMIELAGPVDGTYVATTLESQDGRVYGWTGTAGISTSTMSLPTWEQQQTAKFPGMVIRSIFDKDQYLGRNTIWGRFVHDMPLAANSAALANWMATLSPTPYNSCAGGASGAFGQRTSLNTSSFGTVPIVSCVMDSTDPDCHFQYMDSCAGPGMTTAEATAMLTGRIPWPLGLLPPVAGDKGFCIFDVGTGITREYFGTAPVANKPGHWTATVGAYSVAEPHFPYGPGINYATQYKGSNAVVRMHNVLGQIGISEVRAGEINHALGFTMANATCGVAASYPALASDGKFPASTWSGWLENGGAAGPYPGNSPRHGQWCRLPLTVDPLFNPVTSKPYNPLTQMIIRAAQTYGMVGTDTNAWAHAFNGEPANREMLITGGSDPWATNGELATLLDPAALSTALNVNDFPWELTEWAVVDWGRPNPDFMLRSGETSVFEPHGG
jgi:hypothetical protein